MTIVNPLTARAPPETLAIREVAAKSPCPLRIAEIRVDNEKHKHIRDAVCQIIRYDFSKLGIVPQTVKYYKRARPPICGAL
jgi:hypothetical protein